jgi:hypothetical protein
MEGDLSVTEVVTETGGLPTFELDYRYDDPADPDEVTIYDTDAEEPTTTWVTVSIEDTVSLDTVA